MAYNTAFQGNKAKTARAVTTDAPISHKAAIMLGRFLKGASIERARAILKGVQAKKEAVPYTRFTEGAGHKPSIGPGKYPIKAAGIFSNVLESAIANAKDKGLSDNLMVETVITNKGQVTPRYGRWRGRDRKATHVEIVLKEQPSKKKAKSQEDKK